MYAIHVYIYIIDMHMYAFTPFETTFNLSIIDEFSMTWLLPPIIFAAGYNM